MIYGDDPENTFPGITAIQQSSNLYVYAVGGVSISVAGAAAGTATVTYGGTVAVMASSNFGSGRKQTAKRFKGQPTNC